MSDSYWIQSSEGKRYPKLQENTKTDYLIIGGGFAGLTSLYLLTKAGLEVTLVDADRIGYGCSGRNTGKISCQHGLIYNGIENKFGIEKAKQYYEINYKALELIENLVDQYQIECDFLRLPAYLFTQDDNYVKKIEKEYETYQKLNIDCKLVKELPIPVKIKNAVIMDQQAQFHPKRYLDRLAQQAVKQEGVIYEDTRVIDFEPGDTCKVKTEDGHSIEAKNVIIASHFPCYDGKGFYFAKLEPLRTYAVMARFDESFPQAHFINAENPTRSVRYVYENNSILLVGESHKVGHHNEDHYLALKKFGNNTFKLTDYEYEWSAQDYIPPHNIPYIGYLNKDMTNIYVATGFLKWGISTGTAAGIVLHNMILNGESKYQDLYTHSTLSDIASKTFVVENADVAVQLISGKLRLGDTDIPDEKGIGRVVNIHGKRCGFYKDEDDEIYLLDITCTHMGCELKWNELEKSWDCPCHGSRFNYKGEILDGPAELPLNSYKEKKNTINPQII